MPQTLRDSLVRLDDYRWQIPAEGGMRVPGLLFADRDLLEQMLSDRTPEQVKNAAHLPGILDASIAMPDAHWGYGLPVGGVVATDERDGVVSPGAVGYDIGCGVRLMRTRIARAELAPHLEALADRLHAEVPCGAARAGPSRSLRASSDRGCARAPGRWSAAWARLRTWSTARRAARSPTPIRAP
jgi:tRNA-splicing ligase RtcB